MDKKFMKRALELAREAALNGEVPVGAVIVKDGKIISEGKNQREQKRSALSHAEIEAIEGANKALGSWRLDGCEIYVTLEPCPMCAGAILNSRISEVIFGAFDKEYGFADSVVNTFSLVRGNKTQVFCGICEEECEKLLNDFFKEVRQK